MSSLKEAYNRVSEEVFYYLFIEGKPHYYYESEDEAMHALNEWMAENGANGISYSIKPFTEFNDEFPDPYDEYDE